MMDLKSVGMMKFPQKNIIYIYMESHKSHVPKHQADQPFQDFFGRNMVGHLGHPLLKSFSRRHIQNMGLKHAKYP